MPLRTGNKRKKANTKRSNKQLSIKDVTFFIKAIGIMSCTLLLITVAAYIIARKDTVTNVAYTITIIVNAVVTVSSLIAVKILKKIIDD